MPKGRVLPVGIMKSVCYLRGTSEVQSSYAAAGILVEGALTFMSISFSFPPKMPPRKRRTAAINTIRNMTTVATTLVLLPPPPSSARPELSF